MAKKATGVTVSQYRPTKSKRPGVHAKTRNSVNKSGKHYNKPYRGQGR